MKRLALISEYPPMKGGIAKNVKDLATTMSDDFEISVYTYKGVPKGVENQIRIYPILTRKSGMLAALRIITSCVFRGVKIVHLQYSKDMSGVMASMIPLLSVFGKKVIISLNGEIRPQTFYRKYSRVIAHTREQLTLMKSDSRIKAVWIPYGVRNYPILPRKSNGKTILIKGDFVPESGFIEALEAFRKVVRKERRARLVIVGEPSASKESIAYYRQMRKFVRTHKLQKYVKFKGMVEDSRLHKLFSEIDIVLIPHLKSQMFFPNVLAFERAIISTNVHGMRDYVKDGINGFIVEPGDVDVLASKIISITSNKKLLEKMEKHNMEMADKKGWWKLHDAYMHVYGQGKVNLSVLGSSDGTID